MNDTAADAAIDAADLAAEMGTWIAVGRHLGQCPSVVDPDEFAAVFGHLTDLHRRLEAALKQV